MPYHTFNIFMFYFFPIWIFYSTCEKILLIATSRQSYKVISISFSRLAVTKIDVLDDFDEIKVAVNYKMNGEVVPSFPGICLVFLLFGGLNFRGLWYSTWTFDTNKKRFSLFLVFCLSKIIFLENISKKRKYFLSIVSSFCKVVS